MIGVSAAQDGGPGGCTTASSRSPYTLAIAADTDRSLVRGWLWLGLLALIVSGVYSILLVASRTPGINAMLPVADFFRVALVVHVDLSVLVWFLALAGMLWSLSSRPRAPALGWLALALACAGTAMLGIAPFTGSGLPIMANYIPVLDGGMFLYGLAVLGVAAALLVWVFVEAGPRRASAIVPGGLTLGAAVVLVGVLVAVAFSQVYSGSWMTSGARAAASPRR